MEVISWWQHECVETKLDCNLSKSSVSLAPAPSFSAALVSTLTKTEMVPES